MRRAPLAGLRALRHIAPRCPSFPKSRPPSAVWSACSQGRRIARVEARRPDLRRAIPVDLGQRLTGARVTGLGRRAKYGLIDTDRGDTLVFHLGMSGQLADRSERDRRSTTISSWRPTTGGGWRSTIARRFGSLDLVRTDELDEWPPFKALGPEPLDITAAELKRRLAGRSAAIKLLLARPADHRGARQYLCLRGALPRRHPPEAGRRFGLARTVEAAGAGNPRRARRSDRRRRLDACATSPVPTASSAISPRASRSTTAKASLRAAAGRSGESSRAAARPSTARTASVDLEGGFRVGDAPLRCEPVGRAVFH